MNLHENWFLVDPKDKDEYTKMVTSQAKKSLVSFILFFVIDIVLTVILTDRLEFDTFWVSIACGGVWFIYTLVVAIRQDAWKKKLLERNESKLTDSPLDNLRRALQREYYLYGRRTTIVMLCIIAGCTLCGFILAVCGSDYSQSGWVGNIVEVTGFSFLLGMVPALVAAFIMHFLYGRKVKPAERRVCDMLSAQYEEAYYREHPEERE